MTGKVMISSCLCSFQYYSRHSTFTECQIAESRNQYRIPHEESWDGNLGPRTRDPQTTPSNIPLHHPAAIALITTRKLYRVHCIRGIEGIAVQKTITNTRMSAVEPLPETYHKPDRSNNRRYSRTSLKPHQSNTFVTRTKLVNHQYHLISNKSRWYYFTTRDITSSLLPKVPRDITSSFRPKFRYSTFFIQNLDLTQLGLGWLRSPSPEKVLQIVENQPVCRQNFLFLHSSCLYKKLFVCIVPPASFRAKCFDAISLSSLPKVIPSFIHRI
jgi:hypothetical protein